MERAPTPERPAPQLDQALLAAAVRRATDAAQQHGDPARAIDAAVDTLRDGMEDLRPSVFVLEHARLWLVAQRGYAVLPDGLSVDSGITGRAVRLGHPQLAADVLADGDYVPAVPEVRSELAIPLRAGRMVVGVLNIESDRLLPDEAADLVLPLAVVLTPLTETLRSAGSLDLASLARLFVHLGSLRDPKEIATLAAASLAKVLPLAASQVVLWDVVGQAAELASWEADGSDQGALTADELRAVRELVDPAVVCQLIGADGTREPLRGGALIAWLPLRANGEELGALVGVAESTANVEPAQLDAAAVLAAHVAASLDAALALQRERQSAMTDPLTGILNRRGLEEQLERDLEQAHEQRLPLSVLVFDCDDFKDINDRAGHEFGDAVLYEVANVLARSVADGATAARLGGDEFVVVLPGSDVDAAEELGGRLRAVLATGVTDAGFPLRISAGISTYPFDGATPTALLRTADQALYAAKAGGKDRVASFRDVLAPEQSTSKRQGGVVDDERRAGARGDASVLAEAIEAAQAIEAEETVEGVCSRLCKSLVFVVGATACSASRVVDDLLVDTTQHSLREVTLGHEAAYRISDFPLTAEVLASGRARSVSFADDDVDPAEAYILRELGMNAVLILPLRVDRVAWGLVELYEMRLRRFSQDAVAVGRFLTAQAERRLTEIGAAELPMRQPPVYELPSEGDERRPRTR